MLEGFLHARRYGQGLCGAGALGCDVCRLLVECKATLVMYGYVVTYQRGRQTCLVKLHYVFILSFFADSVLPRYLPKVCTSRRG